MLGLWRRHVKSCPHHGKGGRDHVKCSCPIWADGELSGKRYRKTLDTRDWQRALRRLAGLEDPNRAPSKPIGEAIQAFHDATQDLGRATTAKYTRTLAFFEEHMRNRGLRTLDEITTDDLNAYRASRSISPVTWGRELQIFRQFFGFCINRDQPWIVRNPAKLVSMPRGIKPADREPYEPNEITKIVAACDTMGRGPYERLRARALLLLLRYTGLRISDVALLSRDRVRDGEIFLRTAKNGKPVKLPLHPDLQAALDRLPVPRGADGPECRYFFWSGHGTKDAMTRAAQRTLGVVYRASGVARACSHRFRHTLATEVLEMGGSVEEAADILGDSAAIITKHYIKWSAGRQARITNLLAQIWHTPKKDVQVIERQAS